MIVVTLSGEYDTGSELNINGVTLDTTSFLEPQLSFPTQRDDIKGIRRDPPPMPPELAGIFPDSETWERFLSHFRTFIGGQTDEGAHYDCIFVRCIYFSFPTPDCKLFEPDVTFFLVVVEKEEMVNMYSHWYDEDGDHARVLYVPCWEGTDTREFSFVNPRFYDAS